MTCLRCKHGEAKKFGKWGRQSVQRYRCRNCRATFSELRPKPLGNHYTPFGKAAKIIELLNEGMSVRAVSRVMDVTQGTILSLLLTASENARRAHDQHVRGVGPKYVQCDELWTFVHTKQGHLHWNDPREWGDAYVWLALDSDTKLIISYHVGRRTLPHADTFMADLRARTDGTDFQITTDGLDAYVPTVLAHFGSRIAFAQLIKQYVTPKPDSPDWYKAARFVRTIPSPISGPVNEDRISTSHIERMNLNVRTYLRRFTRLALGFSKSKPHLEAAVALFVAWYNFCRIHKSLRVTPAMESGLTDHIWTIAELISAT
jgi:transposase-like protein/IS1 family transposase